MKSLRHSASNGLESTTTRPPIVSSRGYATGIPLSLETAIRWIGTLQFAGPDRISPVSNCAIVFGTTKGL